MWERGTPWVKKLLKENPVNAEAWNVYFANYYRFHFAGGPMMFGYRPYQASWTPYYPHEIEQIKKAVALCPQDSTLKLWYKLITGPPLHGDTDGYLKDLNQQIARRGFLDNDYAAIKYD